MANTLVELTEKLFRVTRKKCECNCSCGLDKKGGRLPLSAHADDCALILLLAECRTQAYAQLYGEIDIPPCHNTGRPTSREGEQAPVPSPPADEQGLTKAIEACKNYATLKELTHQYCRDRWEAQASVKLLSDQLAKALMDLVGTESDRDVALGEAENSRISLFKAVGERDAKQALLDDVALDRRRITLQLGDAVIELERMKERYNHVHAHREDLVAAANQGKHYLEQIGMNPGLQARFDLAIKNYSMEPEDKPEDTETISPAGGGGL